MFFSASLPGMWERTLTIGSAGKTFNVTGWKTGWTVGPANLISAMQAIQTNTIQSCPTPIQVGITTSSCWFGVFPTDIDYPLVMLFKFASLPYWGGGGGGGGCGPITGRSPGFDSRLSVFLAHLDSGIV